MASDPMLEHFCGMFSDIDRRVIQAVWLAAKPDRAKAINALLTLAESDLDAAPPLDDEDDAASTTAATTTSAATTATAASTTTTSVGERTVAVDSTTAQNVEKAKPLCPYGAECYRRTKKHLARFQHATLDGTASDATDRSTTPALATGGGKHGRESDADEHDDASIAHTAKKRKRRPPCEYGSACYRHSSAHKAAYCHPGDAEWSASDERDVQRAVARSESMASHPPSSPDVAAELADESAAPPGQYLAGKVIAITGTLSRVRAEIVKHIESEGGHFAGSVTGAVTHLVAANPALMTSKMQQAAARGVHVVDESFLYRPSSAAAAAAAVRADGDSALGNARDVDEALWTEVSIGDCRPLHAMASGDAVRVASESSDAQHTVKRVHDHYYCTCYAWRNQRAATDARTCKHLRQYLGAAYEAARVGGGGTGAADGGVIRAAQLAGGGGGGDVKHAAPGVMLAHKWSESVDPTGYWLSEKLDGVRAWFDGTRFLSRNGNEFFAPDWFVGTLPKDAVLDGELFAGRGQFQTAVSIVRTRDSTRWRDITYMVFDAPTHDGAFEARLDRVRALLGADGQALGAHVALVAHRRCSGRSDLLDELARVEGLGGEGVMLRAPGSAYVAARSRHLLKVKTFHDAEAVLIAHEPGKGKYTGQTGALLLRMPDGKTFRCGSGLTDSDRAHPPAIGALITYRYQELTADGVPRFPVFVSVRIDGAPS